MMQITSSFTPMPSFYSKEQDIQGQYIKEADMADRSSVEEKKPPYEKENPIELSLPRQTYGLSVIEKMSNDEYQAFVRATAEMNESEKILAAQSLYRLNELKNQNTHNPYRSVQNDRDFLKVFHNAHQAILQSKNV